MSGTIKTIVEARGFGFLTPDDGGDDVFFHARQLDEKLEFGPHLVELRVCYEEISTPRGKKANSVWAAD